MSSTPVPELSNSVAVDVPSFPLRRWIRLGSAMGCESCVKFRMDNRTPGFLSFSGLDCASAICLPVHGSLEAFGWKHSLITARPLPTNESPRSSIGIIVVSGLDLAVYLPVHGSLAAFGVETLTDRSYATSHQ